MSYYSNFINTHLTNKNYKLISSTPLNPFPNIHEYISTKNYKLKGYQLLLVKKGEEKCNSMLCIEEKGCPQFCLNLSTYIIYTPATTFQSFSYTYKYTLIKSLFKSKGGNT